MATIGSVREGELAKSSVMYFIHNDKVVIVAELVNSWEVCVLLAAIEWNVRIRESRDKLGGLVLDDALKDTLWKRPQF